MRVIQINTVCGFGSTGKIMVGLSDIMTENGIDNLMVYGYLNAPANYDTFKTNTKFDRYCHLLKTYIFDMHCFGSKKATYEIVKKIEKYDPDIVHLHNLHGYYLNIEILFKYLSKKNVKVIWTLHDCWGFTGHCSHFDYVNCDRWKELCHSCPQKKEYPVSLFLDNCKSNFIKKRKLTHGIIDKLTIVTPSQWLANLVKESFLQKANLKVIHNGIDINNFKYLDNTKVLDKFNIGNRFVILGVSNVWTERKGYKYFNEMYEHLDVDKYVIILVGVTEEDRKKFSQGIICIHRTQNQHELAKLYSAADVFVNPTLEDNYPTVNLESQACGTPVITFNTGGTPETINDCSGIVVKKGATVEIIEAIKYIRCHQNQFTREECREQAINFNISIKFQEYLNLYKELSGEKR